MVFWSGITSSGDLGTVPELGGGGLDGGDRANIRTFVGRSAISCLKFS